MEYMFFDVTNKHFLVARKDAVLWSLVHAARCEIFSAIEQTAQVFTPGENLALLMISITDLLNFFMLLYILLFALHLSREPELGSALLFMGLDSSMQFSKIVEVVRDLWRLSSPTQLEQFGQGHVQSASEYL